MGHDHSHDHDHDHWPEGFWQQPRRLGQGLDGHGAVDDYNTGRAPGPIFVNRKAEGGFAGIAAACPLQS